MWIRLLFLSLISCALFGAEEVYLKTPSFARSDVLGTSVGIRPYRKTGVRLEAECFPNKLIIHNYGYGGSGMTLAFGGSREVVEILTAQGISSGTIAVLGGGVIGLATAYDLLEKGFKVHLYADQWSPNLTSDIAAGSWTPLVHPQDLPPEKLAFHQKLMEVARERLQNNSAEFKGVRLLTGYFLYPLEESIDLNQPGNLIVHFDNGATRKATRIQRISLDGPLFMKDLFEKVQAKGAILHRLHFHHLEEILALPETVVINCLSLGSRELFNDHELYPVRGQIVHLALHDIDYILYQKVPVPNYFFFTYPWSDRLLLGTVYEFGEEEPINTPEVIDQLLYQAEKCLNATSECL